jgi:uncharacterized protein (TIGR03435 family)
MRTRWRKAAARMAIGAALITMGGAIAFGQAGATFEVSAASGVSRQLWVSRTPQRIAFQTTRVGDVMAFAYGLPLDRIERRPQWMYDEVYDVAVTTAAPTGLAEQKLLVQKLLEERFGLVVHRISTESPVYFLVPMGAKVNFTETKEADAADIPQFRNSNAGGIRNVVAARHASMSDLAAWLYLQVRLPVIDKTGLTGLYDIEIPGLPIRGGAEATIRAVRNALGRDLESHRGTAESLIIDHAEKPSLN